MENNQISSDTLDEEFQEIVDKFPDHQEILLEIFECLEILLKDLKHVKALNDFKNCIAQLKKEGASCCAPLK